MFINLKMYEGFTWTEKPYINYTDSTITVFPNMWKPDCESLCINTENCVGFVKDFQTGWGPGTCTLKSAFNNASVITDTSSFTHIKNN